MSGGIGGVPSVKGRFFKDIIQKVWLPKTLTKGGYIKEESGEWLSPEKQAASRAEMELIRKKKKSALVGGTPESSGYGILKEKLG
jgi:hypothetical protein